MTKKSMIGHKKIHGNFIQGVFFRSTRINTTITRKIITRFLIGWKHFEEKVCRYKMVKTPR